MPPLRCKEGADQFIASVLHDCVYNFRDYVGFTCAMLSILTWMVAQFPQIADNIRNKSAEALSVWFLAEWLTGDTCNLIGCLLTGNQLMTQVYTAMYFICTDVVLVMQYIYYGTLTRRQQRALRNQQRMRRLPSRAPGDAETTPSERQSLVSHLGQEAKPRVLACIGLVFVCGSFMRADLSDSLDPDFGGRRGRMLMGGAAEVLASSPNWRQSFGQNIGWVSAAFYIGSRLAQIYKNWSRRSADGLSLAMFGCAITANVLYGAGILLRTYARADLLASAPWLLGSLGTVALDLVIFSQFSLYREKRLPEQAPLVVEDSASSD